MSQIASQTFIKNFWLDLLAVFWPTSCVTCGVPDREFCADCEWRLLRSIKVIELPGQTNYVSTRSFSVPSFSMQSVSRHRQNHETKTLVASYYEKDLQKILLAFKNNNQTGLAKPLGKILAHVFKKFLSDPFLKPPLMIVLIPSLKKRERERGFSHLQMMCKQAFKTLGIELPIKTNLLQPTRGRTRQVGLSADQRKANAAKLKIKKKFQNQLLNKNIILVDDVITSGATVAAATRLLASCGATVVGVAALAVTKKQTDQHADRHTDSE